MFEKKQEQTAKNKIIKLSSWDALFLGGEKEYFLENFAALVSSGIGVLTALESVKSEIRSKRLRKIIDAIKEDIEGGSPIWRTFEKSGILPKNVISLVRVGEQTGRLSENLKIIVVEQEKDRSFRSKIRSGMLYPAFVLSLTLVVGLGVSWFIIPRLAKVFEGLHIPLPIITKALIAVSAFLGQYGYIAVPSFVIVLALTIYFVFIFPKTKFVGEAMIFRIPGIKVLVTDVELARFGFVMGTLLQAGLTVTEALASLSDITTTRAHRRLYEYLLTSIEDGNSFEKSFGRYPGVRHFIPVSVEQLISVGEQSGNLSEIFINIGKHYEEKMDVSAKNLTVILEPVLLVIVAGGVFTVALSVILPIYSLIGGLNSGQPSSTPPAPSVVSSPTPSVIKEKTGVATSSPKTQIAPTKALSKLQILPTGLGYLNVRSKPSTSGLLVAKVNPGETYEYTENIGDWYKISLSDGKEGWVSKRYVKEI